MAYTTQEGFNSDGMKQHVDMLSVEVLSADGQRDVDPDVSIWICASSMSLEPGWLEAAGLSALQENGVTDAFYLDHHRQTTEWGASGATEGLLVTLAEGAFVQVGLMYAWTMARMLSTQLRGDTPPLTEADAEDWARSRVAAKYDVDAAQLHTVELGTVDGAALVRLRDEQGHNYRLRITGRGPGTHTIECTRSTTAD